MVVWSDEERAAILDIFAKLKYEIVGQNSLARCLIVYPWTQRYFGGFGNLYNAAAIMSNPMVASHGATVLHGLDRAMQNMDNIKATYAELSILHSEKLHVDPDNFKLLGDCLTIVIASQMGSTFTPNVQAARQKFLSLPSPGSTTRASFLILKKSLYVTGTIKKHSLKLSGAFFLFK